MFSENCSVTCLSQKRAALNPITENNWKMVFLSTAQKPNLKSELKLSLPLWKIAIISLKAHEQLPTIAFLE